MSFFSVPVLASLKASKLMPNEVKPPCSARVLLMCCGMSSFMNDTAGALPSLGRDLSDRSVSNAHNSLTHFNSRSSQA